MLGLTPNRVAAIGSVGASVSVGVLAVTGNLPHSWQPTAVLVAALAAKTGVVTKYLSGCQNWDTLQTNAAVLLNTEPTIPEAASVSSAAPTPTPQYNGTAPNDPWPHVATDYVPQVAGAPDPHE